MIESTQIRRNLERVRAEISAAAERAGRQSDEVVLIAVTKYAVREQLSALEAAGCHRFGESRPQQLWQRVAWFPNVEWHLVGHLQRNKVARTLPCVACIHSVDSERLLAAIDQVSQGQGGRAAILLQVNISGEPAKQGWSPESLPAIADKLPVYPHVEVRGLMGMASWDADERVVRRQFARLRELRDELRQSGQLPATCRDLSMGMSHDFVMAVEEGATMVRVGSALFADEDRW